MATRLPIVFLCTFPLCMTSGAIRAQENDPLPTERTRLIPPGGFVDLDTGIILPTRERKPMHADLHFDRDGKGFFVQAMSGATAAGADDIQPGDDWSNERQRLGQRKTGTRTWFVRTDRPAHGPRLCFAKLLYFAM